MFPISIISEDEYGVPYSAHTIASAEELEEELVVLNELLEDASVVRASRLRIIINQLEDLLSEYNNANG